ncbi:MAG: histidine kinase [Candidatus Competibacteraceae bacterium]|jgi:hypothetical protein|nr:histidine kinase [Candidatus Competibacteraceae bacterium]
MMFCSVLKKIALTLLSFAMLSSGVFAKDTEYASTLDALIRLSADRIDTVFGDVAASTRALAEEYVTLSRTVPPATPKEQETWLERYASIGKTVGFKTWPGELQSPPAFQAPQVAFYTYNGTDFTAETFRQLNLFEKVTPLFRAAYRTFDFSWSYFTTADNAMLIYPYLPINEAVNNQTPTEQVYYTSADFKNRRAGWTLPYLDLVGAGMMITVSYPAYDGDTLLGVVSHDITLKQLSESVLSHLVLEDDAIAYIVSASGLVVGVTDAKLAQELDTVNRKAKEAILHYRTTDALQQLGVVKAVASANPWINDITEQVIIQANSDPQAAVISFERDNRRVLATTTKLTGWYVVLVIPQGGK